ncbi:MAG: hypothetical protein R3B53_04865 [Candidatus Paceibacterota bacterium]
MTTDLAKQSPTEQSLVGMQMTLPGIEPPVAQGENDSVGVQSVRAQEMGPTWTSGSVSEPGFGVEK